MRAKLGRRSYALALAGTVFSGTHHGCATRVEGGSARLSVPSRTDDESERATADGAGCRQVADLRVAARTIERDGCDRVHRADRRSAEDSRGTAAADAALEPPALPAHPDQPEWHAGRARLTHGARAASRD